MAVVIDISVEMERQGVLFPGDPVYSRNIASSLDDSTCEVAELTFSSHHGTHIDYPSHFFAHGKRGRDYPINTFVLPALVVETNEPDPIALRAEDLEHTTGKLAPGGALLLKTSNSRRGIATSGAFRNDFTALHTSAAELLRDMRIALVGIDYCSIEDSAARNFPVHRTLLAADILILEGLCLAHVEPGVYTLICAPLNIAQAEAAPVRALLLADGA